MALAARPGITARNVSAVKNPGTAMKLSGYGAELLHQGVDADADQGIGILREQGAVIAADIENDVIVRKARPGWLPDGRCRPMTAHRLVDARPVAIMLGEHHLSGNRMTQLDQTARRAVRESERRAGRIGFIRPWKAATQRLFAKAYHVVEVTALTDAARTDFTIQI